MIHRILNLLGEGRCDIALTAVHMLKIVLTAVHMRKQPPGTYGFCMYQLLAYKMYYDVNAFRSIPKSMS